MTLSADENRKLGALQHTVSMLEAEIVRLQNHKDDCIREIDSKYLTKENFQSKFSPVQMIAFGIVGVLMTLVLGAIMALIVKVPSLVPAVAKIGGM
jgi:cell division protein FtsB